MIRLDHNSTRGYLYLVEDNPIAKAINKLNSERWVATGSSLSMMHAAIEVLANDYNERHKDVVNG